MREGEMAKRGRGVGVLPTRCKIQRDLQFNRLSPNGLLAGSPARICRPQQSIGARGIQQFAFKDKVNPHTSGATDLIRIDRASFRAAE